MQRRFFLQALSATALVSTASAQASSPSVQKVRVTLPSPGSAGSAWRPLIDQLQLNQDPSLAIEWVVADPGKMQVQLSAGTLDVGVFGAAGLAMLASRGSDIVLFGPALNNHGRWIVRSDSPYQSPKDLIGKTIATTAETSETYLQARIAASLNGIDLKKDVKVIHGAPTANLALFERGDVDAIITLEPTATRLVGSGARELARVADQWNAATGGSEDPILLGLAASRQWVNANQETARKIRDLFIKVNALVRHEPQHLRTVARHMGLKSQEEKAIRLLPERLGPAYATQWDEKTFSVLDKQVEVAAKLGLIPQVPAQKIYVQL